MASYKKDVAATGALTAIDESIRSSLDEELSKTIQEEERIEQLATKRAKNKVGLAFLVALG